MEWLPVFDAKRPVYPNHAIARAFQMEGKQVVKVRSGETVSQAGWPEVEALVLEFSDGSLMTLEFAGNVFTRVPEDMPIKPEAVRLRFHVTYAPPMLPYQPPGSGSSK